jgi:hypothetical protein
MQQNIDTEMQVMYVNRNRVNFRGGKRFAAALSSQEPLSAGVVTLRTEEVRVSPYTQNVIITTGINFRIDIAVKHLHFDVRGTARMKSEQNSLSPKDQRPNNSLLCSTVIMTRA